MPSHVGLCGKKSECLMGRYQEAMTNAGIRGRSPVVRLILKIPVCSGSNYIPGFAHCVTVLAIRSSRRRCFSSQ
jgi:hypothetical protein